MPIYDFRCPACEHELIDEYRSMQSANPLCPLCGEASMEKVPTLTHTDLREFHTPIEMYSVAVENIQDVRELQRRCPDADISDDPADPMYGVPIARSRKAKLQVLKASGFEETNSERVRK